MVDWLEQDEISRIARGDPMLMALRGSEREDRGSNIPPQRFECLAIEDGLFCSLNEWQSNQVVEDKIIIRNSVGLQIVQTGKVVQSLVGAKRYIHSGARVCITTFPGEVRQHRRFSVGLSVKYVGAWIDPVLLLDKFGLQTKGLDERLRAFFAKEAGDPFCMSLPLAPRLWLSLDDIFNNQYTGALRHAYITSKVNEIVCETVASLGRDAKVSTGKPQSVSLRTRLAVDTAALIYMRELQSPPSLEQLAARVGINRNKLNEGFHLLFDCSPFDYSKRLRMDWARRLLIDGLMTIQEIAHATGYTSQSAFSRAFSHHYGFPPSAATEQHRDGSGQPIDRNGGGIVT